MNIGMVAGETSGDLLGAGLLAALHKLEPHLTASGVGGSAMLRNDFTRLYDMERLAVMGLVEPLCRLPELFKIRQALLHYFTTHRPDVFIGIDSPDFNLGLELKLRQANIPVVHYVSPSVWAWRKKRISKIAKAVDLILTLFPFEADFYRKYHVPVKFVGHPLADLIPLQSNKSEARGILGLDSAATYIALLPGSRRNEIKYLGELFILTAEKIFKARPTLRFLTSAVNAEQAQEMQAFYKKITSRFPIDFYIGKSHEVMAAADVVLVASGTATLETLLFKRPMVIAYRMAQLTYQIARHLVKIPYIGLPNLLANQLLVPEFIQENAQPEQLAFALLDFIDHPEKMAVLERKFLEIHQQLRCNANEQAALAIQTLLRSRFQRNQTTSL
ncbi:MAG: lpxB [Gammaproteobacteria bacterium]|jgi:lipid-A-disaccharide synthase|nr:lpxB [Gammaproteobacteria bacterium]